ncbi:ADP-ribose diphosphatase [Diatrype stigma]|uniref:ADP-ribose diphosphatase n=1 Tax=Diatrype stigma TaxID=117547 RepID=A0AAN9UQ57_9PEZI
MWNVPRIEYSDPNGKARLWESAERRTRPKGGDIDGVGILAVVEKPAGQGGPEIVLQKQYRPPIDKVCIEVPAGLVDEGETAEAAALRELKEETGYVGRIAETSPMMFNVTYPDPGFCNTNLRMVHVTIDMSLPENQELRPELEENEFIEVFLVPLAKLWEECKRLEAEGYAIDARVGTLAEGIEVAKQIAASRPFRILVGPDKKSFTVHSELLAQMSKPLYTLVNGEMEEASEGVAEWPEVDEETFARFWEFAYTRDYTVAAPGFVPDSEMLRLNKLPYNPLPDPIGASGVGRQAKKPKESELKDVFEQFEDLHYKMPSADVPLKEVYPKTSFDHSQFFLSHARIYVLADYYDIEALMVLSLKKLHKALRSFELSQNRIDDVTVVLDYCFANTVDKGGSQDRLRHLLTLYAACNIETLWPSSSFQDLLERSGELSKDIIGFTLQRL